MNEQRIRELRKIALKLFDNLLDNMGTHEFGHVSAGAEETIVLAEIAKKVNLTLADWVISDNTSSL